MSTVIEDELQRIGFDPRAGRVVGEPQPLARDLRRLASPHVSPDGEWLVYSQTEPQEDLLLSRIDGSERRALTSDAYRDRCPRFSPDGRRIAYYSNRGGTLRGVDAGQATAATFGSSRATQSGATRATRSGPPTARECSSAGPA